jgi:membrane protein implicated in regulation of membrane protease activity
VIIVGTLAIAASVVLGFFAFVVLGSVLVILAAVIGIRLWWFKRKMRSSPEFQEAVRRRSGSAHETIEGEYHVVIDERDDRSS